MMALLCYPDPESSELKNFLDISQRDLTADVANREILGTNLIYNNNKFLFIGIRINQFFQRTFLLTLNLGKMGFIDKSILDILIAQLTQMEAAYREQNSYYGEVFEFGV